MESSVRDGYHAGSRTESVKTRSAIRAPARKKSSTGYVTLKTWRQRVKDAGEKAIPPSDAVFALADRIGLDPEMVAVQWHHFCEVYTEDRPTKLYVDWRATFRNSVRGNWFKLWFTDARGNVGWTSLGLQAQANFRTVRAASDQADTPA